MNATLRKTLKRGNVMLGYQPTITETEHRLSNVKWEFQAHGLSTMPTFTDLCIWYNTISLLPASIVLNIKYKPISNSFPFPFAWQILHSWHTTTASSKCCYAAAHTAQSHTQEDLCPAACYSSPSSWKKNKMCQHFILGHCRVPKTLTFTSQLAVSLYTCWQNSNETSSTLPLSRCPSVPMNHISLPATTPQNHTLHTTTPTLSTPSPPLLHPHHPHLHNTLYLSAWLFFLDH